MAQVAPIPKLVSKLLRREQRRQSGNTRDASVNHCYGPQSGRYHRQFDGATPNGFDGILYSTPSLTINTNTGGSTGLPLQLNPNPGVSSLRLADPDFHQCQYQFIMHQFWLQYVGPTPPPWNERFGNDGGFSIQQPDG